MTEDLSQRRRVEEVFDAVCDLPAGEAAAALDRLCAGDAELRRRVESLLAHDREASTQFLGGVHDVTAVDAEIVDRIDRYELIESIGEGGFGVVYRAEQLAPVRRVVAVKILKPGMDTRSVLARFESERQTLARLDHPSIARVYDAGATASGRPYFAMEMIEGSPITAYCDERRLGIDARLELFRRVCAAIQHAHQRGVIHRDIKPSNVLVAEVDGGAMPKIIDFGIARATGASGDSDAGRTIAGHFVGTPRYMSPEQASLGAEVVDTRSDVYSLGVVLYELLVGVTPIESDSLRSTEPSELRRVMENHEPVRPSRKFAAMEERDQIAAARGVRSAEVDARLRGDLDRVVLKSLERDPERRYESPGALAEDLRRFVEREPVAATAPTLGYRASMYYKRHRTGVWLGGAFAAVLAAGVIGTTVFAVRSAAAEQVARAQATRAERELARANEVKALLSEMITSVSPEVAQGRDTTLLRTILQEASRRVASGQVIDPRIEADVSTTIATAYLRIGAAGEGKPFAERALAIRRELLGNVSAETLATIEVMAQIHEELAEPELAEPLYREAAGTAVRLFGDRSLQAMQADHLLGDFLAGTGKVDEGEQILRKTLEDRRAVLGSGDVATLATENSVASILARRGDQVHALPLFEEIVAGYRAAVGDDDPRTIIAMSSLSASLTAAGRLAEAEPLIDEAIDRGRRVFGEEHPFLPQYMSNLAYLLVRQGRLAVAIETSREIVRLMENARGRDHPLTMQSEANLGNLLAMHREFDAAAEVLTACRERSLRVLGANDPLTLRTSSALGNILMDTGRPEEALPILESVRRAYQSVAGPDHLDTIRVESNLGSLLRRLGRDDEAVVLLRHVQQVRSRDLPMGSPDRARAAVNLGEALLDEGEPGETAALLEEERAGAEQVWSNDVGSIVHFLVTLGRAQSLVGRHEAAIETLTEAFGAAGERVEAMNTPAAEVCAALAEAMAAREAAEPGRGYGTEGNRYRQMLDAVEQKPNAGPDPTTGS